MIPILLVFSAFAIWSTLGLAVNYFQLGPVELAWSSSIVAIIITSVILKFKEKKNISSIFSKYKKFVALLFVFQGLHGILWLIALKVTPIGQAVFIHSMSPVFILLIAGALIKEKYGFGSYVAVGVGLLGLLTIMWGDITQPATLNTLGIGLSIFTAFLAAVSAMSQKKLTTAYSLTQLILVMMLGQFFFGSFVVLDSMPIIFANLHEVIFFGVIYATIPFYLLVQGFKHLKTAQVALIGYSEPVLASIWGALFLNQPVTIALAIGGGLIILSNYLAIKLEK